MKSEPTNKKENMENRFPLFIVHKSLLKEFEEKKIKLPIRHN